MSFSKNSLKIPSCPQNNLKLSVYTEEHIEMEYIIYQQYFVFPRLNFPFILFYLDEITSLLNKKILHC